MNKKHLSKYLLVVLWIACALYHGVFRPQILKFGDAAIFVFVKYISFMLFIAGVGYGLASLIRMAFCDDD